jgi:hypothetical protein
MQALIVKAPLLGLVTKDETLGGKYYHVPILQRGPVGRSHLYATAKTNASGSTAAGFDVTYVNNFQIAKIDGDTVNDTAGNDNALYDAIDHEMKAAIANVRKDLRLKMYKNIGGARGVVSAESTTTLTLVDKNDAINFEEGMEVCCSATDGTSGSLRDSGDTVTVTAINRSAGTLTSDENWTEIASLAAGDYLFADGDFGIAMAGLDSWVPASAPGATTFYGVNRSVDTDRLGGIRYTGTGMPLETAIMNASSLGAQFDADPTVCFCNTLVWAKLANSIGADRQNRITKITNAEATVGYSSIKVATANGEIDVVADPGCGASVMYLLDMSTWVLASVGPLVKIVDDDGLTIRRGSGDDWLIDLKSRANLACRAPGKNVRIAI